MGLDQFLHKKIFLSGKKQIKKLESIYKIFPKEQYGEAVEIIFEIGYWRKANAIHKWFVDNIQDGNDDCGTYYVFIEKLMELKNLCEQVLANHSKANELLPTTEGCFFGNTDYGELYFKQLEDTIEIINNIANKEIISKMTNTEGGWYEYSSSW